MTQSGKPRLSDAIDEDGLDEEASREPVRSELADEIQQLKASIEKAISKRERLPQPMFWSLFNSRIKDLRKRREVARLLNSVFGNQQS